MRAWRLVWKISIPLLAGAGITILVYALSGWDSYSKHGSGTTRHFWLAWMAFSILIWIGSLVFMIVFLVMAIRRRFHYPSLVLFLLGLGNFLGQGPGILLFDAIKYHEYAKMAERVRPLIDAIKSYEQKNGVPPPHLQALVPEYIAAIPEPEIPGTSPFEIVVQSEADDNPWIVKANIFDTAIEFDEVYYCPRQNCHDDFRGYLVPVGDWVYLEE